MNNRRMINHKIPPNSASLVMMPSLSSALPPGSEFVSKKVIPLKRTSKAANYVVGLISFEQYKNHQEQQAPDENEVQEEPPKDIAPPYVLCMNFSQFKPEKPPEIDLSQDNKGNEAFMQGSLLDKDNALLKAWMKKFWDYQTRIPSCCDHSRKFWEWVFMLWPESKFKWNFKNLDRKWFEYMVSFPQFREALRKWMTENEEEVTKDLEKKAQFTGKAGKMASEIKTIISDLNDKLFMDMQEGVNTQEEPNQNELKSLIDNGGILVTYDPAIVTTTCEMHKNEKIACNPDVHAPLLKNFNKNLKKKRDKPKLDSPIFKYVVTDAKAKDSQPEGDKREEGMSQEHIKVETKREDRSSDQEEEVQKLE